MFAIFFHESMNPFHQTVTSLPTVIYTVMLIVCMLYWVVAVLGLIDIDVLDIDMDGDIDATDSTSAQDGIAGLLHRLGLNGVPMTIILTLISIIGWLLCYYATYFSASLLPDVMLIKAVIGIITFIVATYITIIITAQLIKPLRNMFKKLNYDETKHIIGQVAIVRSSVANNERGEAELNDGGAGLLLNIRTSGADEFKKGDEVVVIEHDKNENIYFVIAENIFKANI